MDWIKKRKLKANHWYFTCPQYPVKASELESYEHMTKKVFQGQIHPWSCCFFHLMPKPLPAAVYLSHEPNLVIFQAVLLELNFRDSQQPNRERSVVPHNSALWDFLSLSNFGPDLIPPPDEIDHTGVRVNP